MRHHFAPTPIYCLLLLTLITGLGSLTIPSTAHAQFFEDAPADTAKPKIGMKSMVITPTQEKTPAPKVAAPALTPPSPEPAAPAYKPLGPDEALIKEDDLAPWSDLQFAASAHTKADAQKLAASIEGNRGAVPPQGLFLAAKVLADHDMMEEAALYFFAGKLRLSFDRARWPAQLSDEQREKLENENNKTEDQAAPNIKPPLPYDPHQGIDSLSSAIGTPIISWAMHDPKRLQQALSQTREWDISAPYAYNPGYETGAAIPFSEWKKALNTTRTTYFRDMGSLASQLTTLHH